MLALFLLTAKSPSGVFGKRALTHAAVVILSDPGVSSRVLNMEANLALNFTNAKIATHNLALLTSIAK